jgi:xanthine dehydrogenase accessory factor
MTIKVLLRGGGDLSSGVALRMARVGMQVLICELAQPYTVRRSVSFAQAVYSRTIRIEEISGYKVDSLQNAQTIISAGSIPILIDPNLHCLEDFDPDVIIDGRMSKDNPNYYLQCKPKIIGLGPGFFCGINCHLAIETRRGPLLGRVVREGSPENDTGIPEKVGNYTSERVLRASTAGIFHAKAEIGDHVLAGQVVGVIEGDLITIPFDGMVRGLLHDGLPVTKGLKIGDIDPRFDSGLLEKVSDKALAIGGGALEAILSWPELRIKMASNQ